MYNEIFVRGFNNFDPDENSISTGFKSDEKSLTVQADAKDADINEIVRRFGVTGLLPQSHRVPEYGDFDGIFDYQSAQNAIIEADRSFMALPAQTRARFRNDPQEFLEFCSNADNIEEMRELGLAVPAKVESNGVADKPT